MKISDLEFFLVEIGRTSALPPIRSLLVRLGTDRGLEGWGESWPPWRVGELVARRDALLAVLAGRSVFDIEELQRLEPLGSGPLRAAVEMACWDLFGRAVGQPVCNLLGGQYRQRIPMAARLGGHSADRLARLACEMTEQGFHALVVTSSGEARLDRKILQAVREGVGNRVALRLDAQATFSPDAARDLCAEVEHDHLQFIVDPLATQELYQVASLARQTPVPLAVRRTIHGPRDVLACVRCGAASYVVVDIEQVGGIIPARACATIAGTGGVSVLLGSRPTLGIGTAAMLHFATATPILSEANESAYHQLQDDVLIEPLELVDGMMAVPQGPGLGIEVDRAKIEQHAVG